MTWYEETIAEQNILNAIDELEIDEIPFALVGELMEEVDE